MSKIQNVFVFANMGKLDQLPKSGGQTSARRVMAGLKADGFEVVPIRRHRAELQTRLGHIVEVGYFALYDLFKMIFKMLFRQRKNSIFLQMTYAGALVPYELILTLIARIMGFKCIEYLQGGLVMDTYPCGSALHKWMFKKNMELQEMVLFEGIDALKLTERITTKPNSVYYPSYMSDELIPDDVPSRTLDVINLCFFGRISDAKNILTIIEIFNIFSKQNQDRNTSLTLVGNADNRNYLEQVEKAIEASPYRDRIKLHGNSSYEFLVSMMQKQHFYLFPTKEKAEGHSNALNEAMSQGVIPIASDFHFNKTVIGNEDLVVKGYNAGDYAKQIEIVLNKYNLDSLSRSLCNHVKANFTYKIVNKRMMDAIQDIEI